MGRNLLLHYHDEQGGVKTAIVLKLETTGGRGAEFIISLPLNKSF